MAQDAEVSAEQLAQWMEEVSNWGRWGDDDELGALNLITPEKRRQAAALVREGITVPMAFRRRRRIFTCGRFCKRT